MERSFNNRTSVLYQHPRHPRNYKDVCRRWVLVPMCEYKVSVPYPKDSELNLFQFTVLRMLISGSKDDAYIASKLCLHPELIAFIVRELENLHLIDQRRRLTSSGFQLVKTGADSYSIRTGYIYYNYVTKTFMDAFIPDEQHNEVETRYHNRDSIQFDLGTLAEQNWQKGTILHADTSEAVKPNPYEIVAICKKHNRRSKSQGFLNPEGDDVKPAAGAGGAGEDLSREISSARLLGTKKDVYAVTYIFMAKDDVLNRSKLQVCYPFGEGTSSSLTESIGNLLLQPENAAVKSEVLGLKDEVFGMTEQELEKVRNAYTESEKKIKAVLSDGIDAYPAVMNALMTVESSYLLVKGLLDANTGSNMPIIKKNLDDYITHNYDLLAGILTETAKRYDYFTDAQLTRYVEQNAVLLKGLAEKQGFQDTDSRSADRFFRIKTGAVKSAIHGQQLNALFAYNLIVADHFSEHPFYELARRVPKLIPYLADLRDLRNNSAHPNELFHDFERVSSYRKKNMYIAFLLLDGLQFYPEADAGWDESLDKEKQVKATREAEASCESLYTACFQRNTNIANQLRNLRFEILIKGDSYPNRASEVLEAIFKQALSRRGTERANTYVRDPAKPEEKAALLEEMEQYGFSTEGLSYCYPKERVLASLRDYTKGTLVTLFYAWYYSEIQQPDNMLPAVAKACPELVQLIDEIHKNRAHSGKMSFDDKRLDFTKEHIDHAANTLLDAMHRCGAL